jgi:hypothetical protein
VTTAGAKGVEMTASKPLADSRWATILRLRAAGTLTTEALTEITRSFGVSHDRSLTSAAPMV